MQCHSSQERVFYNYLLVKAKYMNAIVRNKDGVCLNVMNDADVDHFSWTLPRA